MQNTLSGSKLEFVKPTNFDANDVQFHCFENLQPQIFPKAEIKLLKNVRVANNSVVFRYFKIFQESCISQTVYQQYSKGFKFFLKFIFPHLNFSKKRFLLITDEWTSNYYHWHIFALLRLLTMKENNLIEGSKIVLPVKYRCYDFVLSSLKKFGIEENQIVYLRRKSHIKVAELVMAETYGQNYPLCANLRQILTQNSRESNQKFGDRIYISRQKQVLRFVENEQEVATLLEQYGFRKIFTEDLSYEQQINIFANAKYLVAPHGAGITNALFMSENSSVLELSPPPEAAKPVTDYFRMLTPLKIKYLFQQCKIGEKSQVKDFHHASLIVDLIELEKNLRLMLEQN